MERDEAVIKIIVRDNNDYKICKADRDMVCLFHIWKLESDLRAVKILEQEVGHHEPRSEARHSLIDFDDAGPADDICEPRFEYVVDKPAVTEPDVFTRGAATLELSHISGQLRGYQFIKRHYVKRALDSLK